MTKGTRPLVKKMIGGRVPLVKKERSMFTDYTKIVVKSGDGGNGAATFRREKYVAAGRT